MDKTCDNCGNWQRMIGLTVGNCPYHGTTAAGYYCESWALSETPVAQPKPAKKSTSDKWAKFDLAKAAQKVLSFNEPVNIMMVQRRLRCPYTIAAKVAEYLKRNGAIE